jgi:hypothetical protein
MLTPLHVALNKIKTQIAHTPNFAGLVLVRKLIFHSKLVNLIMEKEK